MKSSADKAKIMIKTGFVFGLIIGCAAASPVISQTITRGADAAELVKKLFAQYEPRINATGDCVPPRTSAPPCVKAPEKVIKHEWAWKTRPNKDGIRCKQGEYLDAETGCAAAFYCDCGDS